MNLVLFLKNLKDTWGLYLPPLYQILCISIKYKSTYAVLQDNKKLGSIFVLVYFVKPVNYPKHVFLNTCSLKIWVPTFLNFLIKEFLRFQENLETQVAHIFKMSASSLY